MNRIFNVIYSVTQQAYVVCSELAKRRTKIKSYSHGEHQKKLFSITAVTLALISSGYGIAQTTLPEIASTAQNEINLGEYDDIAQKYLKIDSKNKISKGEHEGINAYAKDITSTSIGAGSESIGINSTAIGKSAHALGNIATAIGNSSIAGINTSKLKQIIEEAQSEFNRTIRVSLESDFKNAYKKNTGVLPDKAIIDAYLAAQYQEYINTYIYNHSSEFDSRSQVVNTLAIGNEAKATENNSIALGDLSHAAGIHALAIGKSAYAAGEPSIAIGTNAIATENNSAAIGKSAVAFGATSIAIGKDTRVGLNNHGWDTLINETKLYYNVANPTAEQIANYVFDQVVNKNRQFNQSTSESQAALVGDGIAIGGGAQSTARNAISIGTSSYGWADNSVAIGNVAQAGNYYGTTGQDSVAIGYKAQATADASISLGSYSRTDGKNLEKNGFGYIDNAQSDVQNQTFVWKPTRGEISVGRDGTQNKDIITRRLTHLAAGYDNTDAVNVAQLRQVTGENYIHVNSGDNKQPKGDPQTNSGFMTASAGAQSAYDIAIGVNAQTEKINRQNASIAIGHDAHTKGTGAIAFGNYAKAQNDNTIAIGAFNKVSDTDPQIDINKKVGALSAHSIAIGGGMTVAGSGMAGAGFIHQDSLPTDNAIAIGNQTVASHENGLALGINAQTYSQNSIAIGHESNVLRNTAEGAIAIGNFAHVDSAYNVTAGDLSNLPDYLPNGDFNTQKYNYCDSKYPQAMTPEMKENCMKVKAGLTNAYASIAIGDHVQVFGVPNAIVIGSNESQVYQKNGIVIGPDATSGFNLSEDEMKNGVRAPIYPDGGAIALGVHARATGKVEGAGYGHPQSSEKDGQTWTPNVGELSLGSNDYTRRIKHIAAGLDDTDAVNVAQLKKALEGIETDLTNKTSGGSTGGDLSNQNFGLKAEDGKSISQPLNHTITVKGADGNITTVANDNAKTLEISLNQALDLSHKDGGETTYGSVNGLDNHFTPTDSKASEGALPEKFAPGDVARQAGTVGDILNAGWNLQGNGKAVDFVKPFDTVNFVDGEGTHVEASSDGKVSQVKVNINVDGKTISSEPVDKDGNRVVEGNGENGTKKGEWYKPGKDGKADPNAPVDKKDIHHVLVDNGTFGLKAGDGHTVSQKLNTTIVVKGATDGDIVTRVEEGKDNTKALTIDLSPTAKQELADAGKHTELASSNTTTATQVTTEGKNKGKWVVEVRKEDIPLVNDNGKVVSLTDADAANKFVDAEKLSRALGKMGFTVKSGQKDDTGKMIKSGGEVIFRAGDNMSVSRTDSTFTFETSKDPHFSSITVNGSDGKPQVIIDKNGINAGDKPITHVADGTNPHDAVNVKQLKNVIQANHAHLENGLDTFVIGSGTRYDPFRVNVETGGIRMENGAAVTLDSKTLDAFRAAEARLATASKAVSEAVKNLSANPHDEGLKSKLAESIKVLKLELDHAQDTYRASDYTKLTTVQAVGEAINRSGFNVLATATEGGKVKYVGTVTTDEKHPMMIHPSDMMRYKAGKNMEISQNNADFTFALQDNIGVNSVTVGGQDGQVKMTADKGADNTPTLNLTDGNGTENKPVQIKNVAAGKEGTDAVNVNQLNNVADSIKKDVKIKFQGDEGEKNEFSRGNDGVVQIIGDKKNIEVNADKDKGTLTVHLKDHLTDITSINGLNNTTVTDETGTGNRKNMAASEGQIRYVYDIAVKKTIVKGLDGVHVDESNDGGHPVYTISIDGDKVAKSANLTYKANGTNDHSVTMKSGLDFRDGHNTKARIDVDGKVYYDIDPNLTHMQSISSGEGANGAKISLSNKDKHISVNGGKVTDVAKGSIAKDSTDAVNGSQLYETNVNVEANTNAIHKGLTFGGNVGEGQHKLGSTILVVGSEKAQNESYSSDNLTTVYTKDDKGNGSIQVQMKDKPTFKGIEITDKTGKAKVKITAETGKGRATPSVKISTHVTGGKEAPVRVQNIADGTAPTDAVNVRQVNQALGNIATRFDGIDSRISDVDKHSSAGTATASALATLPQAFTAGTSQLSAATARYRGQSAIAIGYSRISDNNKWIIRFSGSTNTQKNTVGAVGIGYSW